MRPGPSLLPTSGPPGATMTANPQCARQPKEPGKRRHVVVVPSLWTPFQHRPAVSALVAFVRRVPPDRIVFLGAPADRQAWDAFADTLAAFRAVYAGWIGVHVEDGVPAGLAGYDVTTVAESAPVAPGWVVVSHAAQVPQEEGTSVPGGETTANVVCGGTGRLRLTGRAMPAGEGTVRAWLVFECGTLAADPSAGTLGFGVLDIQGATVSARPVRIEADGSFTVCGARYQPSG